MTGGFGGSVYDIGLLYGRAYNRKLVHVSFAVGVGWVIEEIEDGYSTSPIIGLPLELQLNWTLSKGFSLRITGFANINKDYSFSGVALTLQLGKLR